MAPSKTEKQKLRQTFIELRDNLNTEIKKSYDRSLNNKLIELILLNNFQNIHVFLPMNTEPNIFPFINNCLGKKLNVVCPKSLKGGRMENYILNSTNDLSQGIYGTSFPAKSKIFEGNFDLIIVPGLAFNKMNDRLGYGGGYYDRFLSEQKRAKKIAIAYPFQIVDSLPVEDHDIKMDEIICAN